MEINGVNFIQSLVRNISSAQRTLSKLIFIEKYEEN